MQVLHPLEVTDHDSSGVGQNVGHDDDTPITQDFVSLAGGGTISAFHDHLGLDVGRVVGADLMLQRGWDQHIYVAYQQFVVGDLLDAWGFVSLQQSLGMSRHVLVDAGDIQAVGVIQPATDVAHRYDRAAHLVHDRRRVGADVAVALHRHCRVRKPPALALQEFRSDDGGSPPSRLLAPQRPTQGDWFARDDVNHGLALQHADRVGDPGHGLSVGVDVRRWDIPLRADDGHDHGRKAARHTTNLIFGHLHRVAPHPTFGPAVGDIHHSTLPGHQGRQRSDLAEVHVRVITDAALARSSGTGVLDAVARENLDQAVVHHDRHGHRQFPLRVTQDGVNAGIQAQSLGDFVELSQDCIP